MGILVNLDDVMMARDGKRPWKELPAEVDITMANLSILKNNRGKGNQVLYPGGNLQGALDYQQAIY